MAVAGSAWKHSAASRWLHLCLLCCGALFVHSPSWWLQCFVPPGRSSPAARTGLRTASTHHSSDRRGRGHIHGSALALVSAAALTATLASFVGKAVSRRQKNLADRGSKLSCNAGPVLFGSMGTRSPLVNWYLFEIGRDFEMVEAARVDRSVPDYPHPFGQIPALRDGDVSVFESGAILMYLADKYGGLDTPEKRAEANKWVVWANATLDGICFKEDGNGRVLDTGLRGEPKQIARLDQMLADRDFILGNGEESFSVADVAIGSYLLYVPIFFNDISVAKWPNVQRYMLQLCQRPAYVKAFGGGTSQDLVRIISKKEESKMFGLF